MRFLRSKKNTQEKIKEATFELLVDKGYAGINMRDIAKKAQTAVGQLTYYYGTKENLIVSVIEELINGFIAELKEYINKDDDKLQAIDNFFAELFEKENGIFKVIIDFTAQSLWNDTFKNKVNDLFIETTNLIENAYIKKGFDEVSAKNESSLYMATICGKALQKVFYINNVEKNKTDKSFEKERKVFNAKPANGLL